MNTARTNLDDLRIASPCKADWNQMVGDDAVRFCGLCQKNVYDLRNMTRAEGEELLAKQGETCVRMALRADGTLVSSDCPVGARDVARKRRVAAVVGGGLLAASALLWKVRADARPAFETLRDTAGTVAELATSARPTVTVEPKDVPPPDDHGPVMMGAIAWPEPVRPVAPPKPSGSAPPR